MKEEAPALAVGMSLEPIQLVVEVVSTNWEDDYIDTPFPVKN